MAFLKAHSIDYRMRTNRKIDPINKETGLGGSYDTFFLANSWGVHALHAAAVSWPWNMHACMHTGCILAASCYCKVALIAVIAAPAWLWSDFAKCFLFPQLNEVFVQCNGNQAETPWFFLSDTLLHLSSNKYPEFFTLLSPLETVIYSFLHVAEGCQVISVCLPVWPRNN